MKYLFLLLIFFAFAGYAQQPLWMSSKDCFLPIETPLAHATNAANTNREVVLIDENFDSTTAPNLPEGWSTPLVEILDDNTGAGTGEFTPAWKTGDAYDANNGGYLPIPHIVDNQFAYVSDDGDPCNCDMVNVGLITPELDFSGLENMVLTFDAYSQPTFGGDNLSVAISTDGSEYITLHTASSSPEWQPIFVDLSLFDNEPSVWIKFYWSDNNNWSSGAAIDNVLIAENLNQNVAILRAHTAEYTAAWNDTSTVSGEYSVIPYQQATPLKLGATIMNKGAEPIENVVLSVSIFREGTLLGSFNSQVISMMEPQSIQDVYATTNLTPNSVGAYTVEYNLIAATDEDLSDNSTNRSFAVSEDVYAMDDGAADSFRNNSGSSYTIGNLFEVVNDGSICYSIGVAIGTGSLVGTEIYARLYDSNFIFISGSDPYTIQPGDLNFTQDNIFVNIPLQQPEVLQAGKDYLAVITYFAFPGDEFIVSNSGTSQEQFSVFQDEIGDWFYVTTTPMVRMNLSASVGLDNQHSNTNLLIYPNPVLNELNIVCPEAIGQPNTTVLITDATGRMVVEATANFDNAGRMQTPLNLSQLSPGAYQVSVLHNGTPTTIRFIKQPH